MGNPTSSYLSQVNQSPYFKLRPIADKGYLGGAKNLLINMTKVIGKLATYIFASIADFSIGLGTSVKNIFVSKKIAQIQQDTTTTIITAEAPNENNASAPALPESEPTVIENNASAPALPESEPTVIENNASAPALPESEPTVIENNAPASALPESEPTVIENNASAPAKEKTPSIPVTCEEKDEDDLSSVSSVDSEEEKYPTSSTSDSNASSAAEEIPELESAAKKSKTEKTGKAVLSPASAPEEKSSCAARVATKVSNAFHSVKSGTYQAGCSLGNGIVYAGSSVKSGMYNTGSSIGNGIMYVGSSIKNGIYNSANSARNLFNLTSE